MKFLFIPLALFLLMACGDGNPAAPADTGDGPKTQADSLLQDVIDGHDVAMPKMKKLERLMKESKSAIDSLDKLPAAARKQNSELKVKLEAAFSDLSNADKAMHEWMNGFRYDSLENNQPERIKYLQDQKTKVNLMKDAVLSSISKAEEILTGK
ncbi:viral A-type inclusion protein [Niabella beijingensis]|uniref:viral A-type inclusion protein n=1 Tax=Niabella beijingensis TaxID=2872700 RepID=UPI001CBE760B|nr:viral A-type inclusion protein [Niabella beijingensis]MBZ4189580.1 viral A-type inclusion protein [Niabella beijingensis]